MKKFFLLSVFALLFLASGVQAQTESSHYKAAETLLTTMGTAKSIDDNLQQMLTMQMEQVPGMKAAELEVRSFFSKYMNYDAIKGDLIQMYMDEFTEKELKEMTAFFNTPTGKKMASKQTTLTMRSAQIGQEKIQPHLPELQQMMQKKMQGQN